VLPPDEIISGTKVASTTARAISSWKCAIAVAVSISLRKSTTSHTPRLRTMSASPTSK